MRLAPMIAAPVRSTRSPGMRPRARTRYVARKMSVAVTGFLRGEALLQNHAKAQRKTQRSQGFLGGFAVPLAALCVIQPTYIRWPPTPPPTTAFDTNPSNTRHEPAVP